MYIIYDTELYFLGGFFLVTQAGQWPVRLTMGCTARGLTACRLRTYVMTNYISYTELDFLNLFL